jgi:hypothetical protein
MLKLYVDEISLLKRMYWFKRTKFYNENFKLSHFYDNVLSPEFGNTQIVNLDVPPDWVDANREKYIRIKKKSQ